MSGSKVYQANDNSEQTTNPVIHKLEPKEINILSKAKIANQFWFMAVIHCASVMIPRREKYSGNGHSYFNFADLARRMSMKVVDVFRFYLNIKVSRLGASSGDFDDEKQQDTWTDAANYALIALGWLLGKLDIDTVLKESDND